VNFSKQVDSKYGSPKTSAASFSRNEKVVRLSHLVTFGIVHEQLYLLIKSEKNLRW